MKFYKNFIVVWLIIYLTVAIAGRLYSPNKEYFPFFRWSLYSKTPHELTHPYIMVSRFGGEKFSEPVNIVTMKDYHHIGTADMNLIVYHFYGEVILKKKSLSNFLKLLPSGSEFILYERKYDLSLKDYEKSQKTRQIAVYKNNQLIRNE